VDQDEAVAVGQLPHIWNDPTLAALTDGIAAHLDLPLDPPPAIP
jgi:hypothetical protein